MSPLEIIFWLCSLISIKQESLKMLLIFGEEGKGIERWKHWRSTTEPHHWATLSTFSCSELWSRFITEISVWPNMGVDTPCFYCALLHCVSQMLHFFFKLSTTLSTSKNITNTLLRHLLYCNGMESNPWYLWGRPVFKSEWTSI